MIGLAVPDAIHELIASMDPIVVYRDPTTVAFLFGLGVQDSRLRELESLLSSDEIARAQSMSSQMLHGRFVVRRGLRRLLLADEIGVDPGELAFEVGPFGKPYLVGGTRQFSASSSGDWGLHAISKECEVGVDLEIVDAQFDFEPLLADSFTAPERAWLDTSSDPRKAFYEGWTFKEACAKATGLGLGTDLRRFEMSGSARWETEGGYMRAVRLSLPHPLCGAVAWHLPDSPLCGV